MTSTSERHEIERQRLVTEARRHIGKVTFKNGENPHHRDELPEFADCSGFVNRVWCRIFPDRDGALYGDWFPQASLMWMRLKEARVPEPGDLAFYSRDGQEIAHVMTCTENGKVLGCCPEAGTVHEYASYEYSTTWKFMGFRRLPLKE